MKTKHERIFAERLRGIANSVENYDFYDIQKALTNTQIVIDSMKKILGEEKAFYLCKGCKKTMAHEGYCRRCKEL